MYYQDASFSQEKFARVIDWDIWVVAVDIRENSKTFVKWFGLTLSASNFKQLWISEGFAHGFYVLSDFAQIEYKTTNIHSFHHKKFIL